MTRRLTIRTSQIKPPIPTRKYDWQAVMDNYEPDDPIGTGPTEADAVMDLYAQIAEREECMGEQSLEYFDRYIAGDR